MKFQRHRLMGSQGELDLSGVEAKQLEWLASEALTAGSWTEFQQRTAHGVIEGARLRGREDWEQDSLYRLQLDLVGQVGVASGELRGELTESFGSLVLGALCLRRTSRLALLMLLAAAERVARPVEPERLHLLLYELWRRSMTPFTYAFELRPPNRIFSADLADDYETIQAAGLVAARSPIHETSRGRAEVDRITQAFSTLLPAVKALAAQVEPPSVEQLFARCRADSFAAAI